MRISEIIIPKYLPIFNDTKIKHIILTSGRAGTKSSYAAIRSAYQIVADAKGSVVVLRKHHNKLRKTVYKEMLRGINRLGIPKEKFRIMKSPMEITYKKNGSTIYFSGSDGIDDTKGIIDEDRPIKLVVVDELTEFFEGGEGEDELSNIEATFVRGNRAGFQMIYLYNPPKNPNAPVNQWCRKMEERADCLHVHTDYRDVPESWLGRALIESAEEMKRSDPKLYRWIWLGESIGVDDLIYYMFSAEEHVYDPEKYDELSREAMGEIGVGVDYGQQNATVFEAFGIDYEGQMFRGLKEYYHSGRETGRQKSPSEYARDLRQFCDEIEQEYKRVVGAIYIDPSAAGLIEEVRRQLPHVDVVSARNDVKLGISRMQKFLSFNRMAVSRKQKWLIREMGMYQYDAKSIDKGKEEPVKASDHCLDACRYVLVGMWRQIAYMLPASERSDEN